MIQNIFRALRAYIAQTPFFEREHHSSSLRLLLAGTLFFFWLITIHRPYLPLLYPMWSGFRTAENWSLWGIVSLWLAFFMALLPVATIPSQIASLLTSAFFFFTAGVFTGAVGITTGSTTYTLLGVGAIMLFGVDFKLWLPNSRFFRYVVKRPPRWFKDKYGRD